MLKAPDGRDLGLYKQQCEKKYFDLHCLHVPAVFNWLKVFMGMMATRLHFLSFSKGVDSVDVTMLTSLLTLWIPAAFRPLEVGPGVIRND
jgi:hypothetical protein